MSDIGETHIGPTMKCCRESLTLQDTLVCSATCDVANKPKDPPER